MQEDVVDNVRWLRALRQRARLSVASVPWHIIQRGSNRAVCFHAEGDYRRYLDDLAEQSKRFGCTGHVPRNAHLNR